MSGSGERSVEPGQRERACVDEGRVAVDALEEHRVIGHRAGERLVRRELLPGPQRLVPAAAGDPGTRRQLACARLHPAHQLFHARDAREVDVLERLAEPLDVPVRVLQPRNGGTRRRDRWRSTFAGMSQSLERCSSSSSTGTTSPPSPRASRAPSSISSASTGGWLAST
jgi:hypothetical protein